MLSDEQKAIIKDICQCQEESLLRVMENQCEKIKKELEDEGYNVSVADIAEQIAKELSEWDRAKEDPDKFLSVLSDQKIGMLKHYLVADHLGNEHTRRIWKQLNLYDNANERSN